MNEFSECPGSLSLEADLFKIFYEPLRVLLNNAPAHAMTIDNLEYSRWICVHSFWTFLAMVMILF